MKFKFPVKTQEDQTLAVEAEIPDELITMFSQGLAKLSDSSNGSEALKQAEAKLADSETLLLDAEKRATEAVAELEDIKQTVQSYTREQWEEIGTRLGFLTNKPSEKQPAGIKILKG
jgi:hypothetical protein